jgi:hypothetical protein
MTANSSESDSSSMALVSVEETEKKRIRRPRDTKEIVAFWWEIYRALVMNSRVLGGVGGEDIKDAFEDKRKSFYGPWGDVSNSTFEAWWKIHRNMFIEEAAIQEVPNEKISRSPTRLYVSINLKKPHSKLIPQLREWIVARQTKQGLLQSGKRKSRRKARFRYNERTEIHLPTFRELHRFFKYVYLPELYPPQGKGGDQEMKGMNLWKAALRHYRGKPRPKYLRLGNNLTPEQKASVLRTLRRYVVRLDDMCRHVAYGQFP